MLLNASGGAVGGFVSHDADGGLLYLSLSHLAGSCTFPYKIVETTLLCGSFHGGVAHICGADGLVCLLRSLRVGVEIAR